MLPSGMSGRSAVSDDLRGGLGAAPPRGGVDPKWWTLAATGAGNFLSALGGHIITPVLPVVASDLQTDVAAIEWVLTVYLLTLCGLLLTVGRLGDLHGHRRLYLGGLAIFTLGALLCGLAPDAWALVAFRAVQAIGAAMVNATMLAILTRAFPAAKRGQAIGYSVMLVYLGLMLGPSLGGWLTTEWGWRTTFLVNVPVGALTLLLSLRFIPADTPGRQAGRFDVAGAATFTLGLVLVLLALNQGQTWGWVSPATLAVLAAGLGLLGLFVVVETRVPSPMLDLGLFRNRTFSAAAASAVLNYVAVFGATFVLPFYLIHARSMSPTQAGLLLTTQPLLMAIVAPIAGTLSDRIGSRPLAVLGMAVQAVGLLLLSRLGPDSLLVEAGVGLALVGVGIGLFTSPNNSAVMGAAPAQRQGIASGVVATARFFGMALGVGLAGAIYLTALGSQAEREPAAAISHAFDVSVLVLAGVAALGAVTSAVRERFQPGEPLGGAHSRRSVHTDGRGSEPPKLDLASSTPSEQTGERCQRLRHANDQLRANVLQSLVVTLFWSQCQPPAARPEPPLPHWACGPQYPVRHSSRVFRLSLAAWTDGNGPE
jgi:EmrB/QacA subfamily drug resistance transporter